MYVKKIPIETYCVDVVLIISENFKEVREKYKLKGDYISCVAFCFKRGKKFYVAIKPDQLKANIVVHETVHLVNFIFDYICHSPTTYNDEPQAYLQEFIFTKIQKGIKKFKTKNP